MLMNRKPIGDLKSPGNFFNDPILLPLNDVRSSSRLAFSSSSSASSFILRPIVNKLLLHGGSVVARSLR